MVPHSHIALMDEPGNVNLDDNEDEEQLNNPEDVWESFNEVVQEAVANEEMLLLEQEGQVNKGDDKTPDIRSRLVPGKSEPPARTLFLRRLHFSKRCGLYLAMPQPMLKVQSRSAATASRQSEFGYL